MIIREDEIQKLSDNTLCQLIRLFQSYYHLSSPRDKEVIDNTVLMHKELAIRWGGNPLLNKETHPGGRIPMKGLIYDDAFKEGTNLVWKWIHLKNPGGCEDVCFQAQTFIGTLDIWGRLCGPGPGVMRWTLFHFIPNRPGAEMVRANTSLADCVNFAEYLHQIMRETYENA